MYIVGTSGHIDHGKTSLIKALTGIDCDRLPEEKEREMTIDIGFAQIEYPAFGTVSIIDVPGHERFIRNMVAGAWGIDLALLVIAADDSWMPQTEDHFRVIELLGIERIIVVLNKIDIVNEEMIELTEEEIKEKLSKTKYKDSDIAKVSAKTGSGIEELKGKILQNLKKLSIAANAEKPFLFIDRVFESKGHGTIITGTLKNGNLNENETVIVLPGQKKVRIKKIESHHHSLNKVSPSQRTALNLHDVAYDELKRGDILVKENFFTESDDIVANIKFFENKKIKNNLGIEILLGTSAIKGKIILINDVEENENVLSARIKFDNAWYFYPGESFIITNPGGYRIIGGGKVLLPNYNIFKDKKILKSNIGIFENFSAKEIVKFIFKVKQAATKDEIKSQLPYGNDSIEKIFKQLLKEDYIIQVNEHIAIKEFYLTAKKSIITIIKGNVGLNIKEISDKAGIKIDFAGILVTEIKKEDIIIEKDGKYFTIDHSTVDSLSDEKKKILSSLERSSTDGLELDKLNNDSQKKGLKELIRLGFAISLDGNIIYHPRIYEDLKIKILNLFNNLEKITIADARECTSLSRKYLIPLLNRIENDGLIKRIGDFRIKA